MSPESSRVRSLLTGGDRRSIARAPRALAIVRADPSRVDELVALTDDDDPLVMQRALDLLEKLAHDHPEWIEPHKRVFIGPLARHDRWEVRLQIVRALPLFTWTRTERRRVIAILRDNIDFPQTFVRAWALDSLSTFAADDPAIKARVRRYLRVFEAGGSKALAARARHIRARLGIPA
jgi:hypothetical protein